MRARLTLLLGVSVLLTLAFGGGWLARGTARVHAGSLSVDQVLAPTSVPIGSRALIPVFARDLGETFELHLRLVADGNAATGALPAPSAPFKVAVRSPSGDHTFLAREGRLGADSADVRRVVPRVADVQTSPPTPPSLELVVPLRYRVPHGEAQTLEIEVGAVAGSGVTRAVAEVSVYELAP